MKTVLVFHFDNGKEVVFPCDNPDMDPVKAANEVWEGEVHKISSIYIDRFIIPDMKKVYLIEVRQVEDDSSSDSNAKFTSKLSGSSSQSC